MCLQLQRFKDEKALGKEVVNGEKARVSPIMKSNSASLYWSVVVFAFMICWVPFWMIVILRRFSSSPRNVELFFMFLLYSSNAVNPFIYAGMSPAFLCKHWHEVHVAYNRRGMSEDAAETPNMDFLSARAPTELPSWYFFDHFFCRNKWNLSNKAGISWTWTIHIRKYLLSEANDQLVNLKSCGGVDPAILQWLSSIE